MSTPTPFEAEMLKMMKQLTTDVSDLKSDMGEVKSRLSNIEIWNDKAFGAIEDLRTELKSDGAATRGMIYEAYEQISDMRDVLEQRSPRSGSIPVSSTRYPRVSVTR